MLDYGLVFIFFHFFPYVSKGVELYFSYDQQKLINFKNRSDVFNISFASLLDV